MAPALLGGLAGDIEPSADFGPAVTGGPPSVDGLLDGAVGGVGEADQVG
jgi:hypothetical protein